MAPDESVTEWLDLVRAGDPTAARLLWERYFGSLVAIARKRLQTARLAAADEDVALSAFDKFCRAAEQGRFPRLADRDDLWRLLVALTERKAIDHLRREGRAKRGSGRVFTASTMPATHDNSDEVFARLPGREPTPEFAAQVSDECRRLLALLGDDTLRQLALLKLEGYANEEIAEHLQCALRSVERKLALIRALWEREVDR